MRGETYGVGGAPLRSPRLIGGLSVFNRVLGRLLAVAAAALMPLAVGSSALPSSASTTPTAYTWQKVIDNGGRANAICSDPLQAGRMMGMGDVWGPHETLDGANSWLPRMQGAQGIGSVYGRACAYSIKNPGLVYVGIGTLKGGGGYFGVVNGWKLQVRSRTAQFGTKLAAGAAGVSPRAAGNLIQVDYDKTSNIEYVYALTSAGLQRSTDGGVTWTKIGGLPAVAAWKALAIAADGSLYAASYSQNQTSGSQIWHITNPRAGASSSLVSGAPPVVNDLVQVGAKVLVAAGGKGIYSISGNTASAVATSAFSGTDVSSIAAAGNVVVAATGTHPSGSNKCQARSTDGGLTWTWQSAVKMTDLGDGRPYWLASGKAAFCGDQFATNQIAIDPSNPNLVVIAGKGGFWATQNGGQLWQPAGNGAGGSEVSNVRLGSAGQVTTNDVDWTGITTSDRFTSYAKTTSPGSFGTAALTRSVNGHTYAVSVTADTITMDGVAIADDYAKAAIANAHDLAVSSDGYLYVALYGGGLLRGTPN
jgi:hypothetical protein